MKVNLLEVIASLPESSSPNRGRYVSMGEIIGAMRDMGFDNVDRIKSDIEEFGRRGILELVGFNGPDDDLLVGVRLNQQCHVPD